MKLKVLKERTQNVSIENDLRGLGHFEEPMPKFELSLKLEDMGSWGAEETLKAWGMHGIVEEDRVRFHCQKPPHIQAVHAFFCAADLMRRNLAKSLRIDFVQGVREVLDKSSNTRLKLDDEGLILHPAALYHFHEAGFWREDFSIDEIEGLMQKRSLLLFTAENVQILMENLGFDYSNIEGLSYAQ